MAASLSQPEQEQNLQPGLEPKVLGEEGLEEDHQKEQRAQALRDLLLARKKKAGPVSPDGKTAYLLVTYYGLAILI